MNENFSVEEGWSNILQQHKYCTVLSEIDLFSAGEGILVVECLGRSCFLDVNTYILRLNHQLE